jgi:hypothetical protein
MSEEKTWTPPIRHYIVFFSPGILRADTQSREIDHRDPYRVEWPDGAYAFRFFDLADGSAAPLNESPDYYHPDSFREPVAYLKQKDLARDRVLVKNMEQLGCDEVVRCRGGSWTQPYLDEDTVILERR